MDKYLNLLEEYFKLIENCSSFTREEFYRRCANIIPKIYAATQELPSPTEVNEKEVKIDRDEIINPMSALMEFLGDEVYYDEIFDPTQDEEMVKGCIADDLTDIYLDLKEGYHKWEIGTQISRNEALWDWSFSLDYHMGDHMVDVLRPIQRMIFFKPNDTGSEPVAGGDAAR